MKLAIEKNELNNLLQLIVSVCSKNSSEPIINNVLIRADPETKEVTLSATDYEIFIHTKLIANIKKEGSVCIDASKFFNLAKEFPESLITLESQENGWVQIVGSKTKIRLPSVDPGMFPPISFEKLENQLVIPTQLFKSAVDRTLFCVGDNPSRKNLMGLNLNISNEGKLKVNGADGFRIANFIYDFEKEIGFSSNIIIPRKSTQEIRRILDQTGQEVKISIGEGLFQIETDQVQFKTKLIDSQFPNLDSILIDQGKHEAYVSKVDLIKSLKLLSLVTSDKNSCVKLTFGNKKISAESEKQEYGDGYQEIPCDYSGEEFSIGFNIKYLLEAAQVFEPLKSNDILFHCVGPEAPCMINSDLWENFKTILMPMKIRW